MRTAVETRLRDLIARSTTQHGLRAKWSRLIGQRRGFLTEYISGKVPHLRLDDLAALLPLLQLDAKGLAALFGLRDGRARPPIDQTHRIRLLHLWDSISPAHRPAALAELRQIARLSVAIRRLSARVDARAQRRQRDDDRLRELLTVARQLQTAIAADTVANAATYGETAAADPAAATAIDPAPSVPGRRRAPASRRRRPAATT